MANFRSGPKCHPKGIFATWLVEQLNINQMTTTDLGNVLGLHRVTISRYINKQSMPTFSMVKKFRYISEV